MEIQAIKIGDGNEFEPLKPMLNRLVKTKSSQSKVVFENNSLWLHVPIKYSEQNRSIAILSKFVAHSHYDFEEIVPFTSRIDLSKLQEEIQKQKIKQDYDVLIGFPRTGGLRVRSRRAISKELTSKLKSIINQCCSEITKTKTISFDQTELKQIILDNLPDTIASKHLTSEIELVLSENQEDGSLRFLFRSSNEADLESLIQQYLPVYLKVDVDIYLDARQVYSDFSKYDFVYLFVDKECVHFFGLGRQNVDEAVKYFKFLVNGIYRPSLGNDLKPEICIERTKMEFFSLNAKKYSSTFESSHNLIVQVNHFDRNTKCILSGNASACIKRKDLINQMLDKYILETLTLPVFRTSKLFFRICEEIDSIMVDYLLTKVYVYYPMKYSNVVSNFKSEYLKLIPISESDSIFVDICGSDGQQVKMVQNSLHSYNNLSITRVNTNCKVSSFLEEICVAENNVYYEIDTGSTIVLYSHNESVFKGLVSQLENATVIPVIDRLSFRIIQDHLRKRHNQNYIHFLENQLIAICNPSKKDTKLLSRNVYNWIKTLTFKRRVLTKIALSYSEFLVLYDLSVFLRDRFETKMLAEIKIPQISHVLLGRIALKLIYGNGFDHRTGGDAFVICPICNSDSLYLNYVHKLIGDNVAIPLNIPKGKMLFVSSGQQSDNWKQILLVNFHQITKDNIFQVITEEIYKILKLCSENGAKVVVLPSIGRFVEHCELEQVQAWTSLMNTIQQDESIQLREIHFCDDLPSQYILRHRIILNHAYDLICGENLPLEFNHLSENTSNIDLQNFVKDKIRQSYSTACKRVPLNALKVNRKSLEELKLLCGVEMIEKENDGKSVLLEWSGSKSAISKFAHYVKQLAKNT